MSQVIGTSGAFKAFVDQLARIDASVEVESVEALRVHAATCRRNLAAKRAAMLNAVVREAAEGVIALDAEATSASLSPSVVS
jgi:hypothetical protein